MPIPAYDRPVVPTSTPAAVGELGMSGTSLQYHDGTSVKTLATASGTFSITEVEVDFGTALPRETEAFTVTDGTVTTTSKIIATQSGEAPTGRQADENEMEALVCRATPGTGSFTLYVSSASGTPLAGKYKINYTVG